MLARHITSATYAYYVLVPKVPKVPTLPALTAAPGHCRSIGTLARMGFASYSKVDAVSQPTARRRPTTDASTIFRSDHNGLLVKDRCLAPRYPPLLLMLLP